MPEAAESGKGSEVKAESGEKKDELKIETSEKKGELKVEAGKEKKSEVKAESKKEKTPEEIAKAAADAKVEAEKQRQGEENVRVGKTLKINAFADFAKKPTDIVVLGDSHSFSSTFIPVHPKAGDNAEDTFKSIFKDVKPGNVVGGDFNVNFLDPKVKGIEALEAALKANGLVMEMSEEVAAQLKILFKTRSVSSMYSQQLFKNGDPDCALKDLPPFKVRQREGNEAILPAAFTNRIEVLANQRNAFMAEAKNLIKEDKYSEASATDLSKKYPDMVSFHDLKASKGQDHQYLESYDKESDTLFIMQNSVKQKPYDLGAHFNKEKFNFDDPKEVEKVKGLYSKLDDLVFKEMYRLLLKRDGGSDPALDSRSREEIKLLSATKIKDAKIGKLTKEDLRPYYTTLLQSDELKAINAILKTPYSQAELDERLSDLTSDRVYNLFTKKEKPSNLTSAATTIYQALNPDMAKEYNDPKYKQCLGLIGNGFLPFVNEKGEIIPAQEIEDIQVKDIIDHIEAAHKSHPTAEIVFAFIEGVDQEDKIKEIRVVVDKLNLQVLKNRDNLLSVCLNDPEQKDMRNLYNSIEEMKKGGQNLKSDPAEGKIMCQLADKVHNSLNNFLWKHRNLGTCSEEEVNKFKKDFETLVHSEDKNIKNQALWKPIVANILIALIPVVGLFAIAIKALHNHYVAVKENRSTPLEQSFFFTQTQSQQDLAKLHNTAFKGLAKELRQEGGNDVKSEKEEKDQDTGPDTGSPQLK